MNAVRAWSMQGRALFARARRAALFRDAFWVLLFSVASRAVMFFGSAHAARCLGPASMGVSAQVQVLVQQFGLAYNGGFDPVAVRRIAHEPAAAPDTLRQVLGFRLAVGLVLALGWLAWAPSGLPAGPLRTAWLLGAPLLLIGGLNSAFVFQGLHRLPLFTAIASAGSALTALVYLLLFQPGMPVGSDLQVTTLVSAATALASLVAAGWLLRPAASGRQQPQPAPSPTAVSPPGAAMPGVWRLIREGWRYWLLAVLVYLYAGFPQLLVAHFVDDTAAGLYRVAFLMAAAIELLFGSINNLLLARLVSWHREGLAVLWSRQRQLLAVHLALGLSTALLAMACAPWFFERFLGSRFAGAVPIFQVLVAGRAVVFLGQIYAHGLVALHLDTPFLLATLAGTVVSVALDLALIPHYGALAAALVNVASEVTTCLLCYWFERRHVLPRLRAAPGT